MRLSNVCRLRPRFSVSLLAIIAVLTLASCLSYSWAPQPITSLTLERENIAGRDVRLHTDSGLVTLHVTAIEFPYIYGKAKRSPGVVELDLTTVTNVETVTIYPSGGYGGATAMPLADVLANPARLIGQGVMLWTPSGTAMMQISGAGEKALFGRPFAGDATVRVDLNHIQNAEIREFSPGKTVLVTLGVAAAVTLAAALLVALTKESCPFVYVDRGEGWELVGEAYAGAAFRSTQRNDLLPLPDPRQSEVFKVRLRNEARETQYTDQAEVVLIDHAPDVRALSTFDAQTVLVGAAQSAGSARDGNGRDISELVSQRDDMLWETSVDKVATVDARPLVDEMTVEFAAPATGQPVLELVAGNTAWLDLVFGRFFAAMGDRVFSYIEQGNDSAAGPRIQRWREREGVDLVIEQRSGNEWRTVAVVPTAGPVALRTIAVPLSLERGQAGAPIQLRMRAGLGFWRIDNVALSTRADARATVRRLTPREARGTGGSDQREIIATRDGQYHAMAEFNEQLDLEFALPALASGDVRDAFLFTSGYYNVHKPVQARWSPGVLKPIRDEPGALARFGRDLAREYLRRQAAAGSGSKTQPQ